MATYTALQIIDLARTLIDREGTDEGVTNASLLPVLSSKYFIMRRRLTALVPDLYTNRQTFTISSGQSSWTITPTDFDRILKVERLVGGEYVPLGVVPLLTAERSSGYRLRSSVIDVFPRVDAPGDYLLTLLTKPSTAITDTANNLTLVEGADLVLALELAALMRPRFNESPAAERQNAIDEWNLLAAALADQYGATPQQIAEVW